MTSAGGRWKQVVVPGLLGAAGGAINAWLCFAGVPARVGDFRWTVIVGGAFHGAALAAAATGAAVSLAPRPLAIRMACAPLVGWIAGCVSWVPLERSMGSPWSNSLLWLLHRDGLQRLWLPFTHFGLVATVLFLAPELVRPRRGLVPLLGVGIAAGVLGSLWWWTAWKHWYFAAIHGVIWGALVGLGVGISAAAGSRQEAPASVPAA